MTQIEGNPEEREGLPVFPRTYWGLMMSDPTRDLDSEVFLMAPEHSMEIAGTVVRQYVDVTGEVGARLIMVPPGRSSPDRALTEMAARVGYTELFTIVSGGGGRMIRKCYDANGNRLPFPPIALDRDTPPIEVRPGYSVQIRSAQKVATVVLAVVMSRVPYRSEYEEWSVSGLCPSSDDLYRPFFEAEEVSNGASDKASDQPEEDNRKIL